MAIRDREFRQMIILDDEAYSIDLPHYCKVFWLSSEQILTKVILLKKQNLNFYNE